MLLCSQLRAARALLGWTQDELASAAKVGLATLGRIEQGTGVVQANFSTVVRLQSTLELQGIRFIRDEEGIGVRLDRKSGIELPAPAEKPRKGRSAPRSGRRGKAS